LELAVSITTFCITALILTTQRRDDQLAEHRDQMTLEFAILSEQKPAKIIQLLEDSRRDIPLVDNRVPLTCGESIWGILARAMRGVPS